LDADCLFDAMHLFWGHLSNFFLQTRFGHTTALICHQKRVLAYGDWVEENVLAPVAHRQYVFTLPRMLRPIFSRRRGLLGELCHVVKHLLISAYSGAGVEGRPGLILFV